MTTGTAGRLAGEIAHEWSSSPALRSALVLAALLQVAGIGACFYTMWSRVRAVGSAGREAKGERF